MTAETDLHEAEAPEEEVLVEEPGAAAPEPAAAEPPKPKKPRYENLEPDDADYGVKVQKRLSKEVGRRYAAEQQAAAAQARAEMLEHANAELRKTYLTSADAAIERDIQGARAKHQRAFSEGDAEAATQAAVELAELSARRAEVQRDARHVPQPQQRQQAQQFTPQTQAYINENPWFNTDQQAQATAVRAHEIAVARGLRPDTSQYFDHITRVVKAAHPEHFEEPEDEGEEDEPVAPKRSAAPPVAPARRTVPGQIVPAKGTLPSLTPFETALCKENNWDMKTYAANKARRMKDGTL